MNVGMYPYGQNPMLQMQMMGGMPAIGAMNTQGPGSFYFFENSLSLQSRITSMND